MALKHWWKLDEANATDVAVDSVGGCDLTPSDTPPPVASDSRFGRVRSWPVHDSVERYLAALGAASESGSGSVISGGHPLAFSFIGSEWSLSWHMRITDNLTTNHGLFYVGKPDNQMCTHVPPATTHPSGHSHSVRAGHLSVNLDASEYGHWRWILAPNAQTSGNNGSKPYPNYSVWLHHALIRRGANVEFWCNGTLISSAAWAGEPYTPQDDFDAANFAPSPEVFWIGQAFYGNALNSFYYGASFDLAHVRLYDHALTEAELIDLAAPDPAPDDTAPVITLISPADGTPIGRNGTIIFDVTEANLRRTPIYIKWPDEERRPWEVVHDGANWGPGYEDSTIATQSSDTLRYLITRAKGWPSKPKLSTRPYDTSGNEAD